MIQCEDILKRISFIMCLNKMESLKDAENINNLSKINSAHPISLRMKGLELDIGVIQVADLVRVETNYIDELPMRVQPLS